MGALAVTEFLETLASTFEQKSNEAKGNWRAYCLFQLGRYQEARNALPDEPTYEAILCDFYLGNYDKVFKNCSKIIGKKREINRLLLHTAQKMQDEDLILSYHEELGNIVEDKLALAVVNFSRNNYQEAADTFKKVLLEHKDYEAINIYIAMCYYKLDYYDVSLELLSNYYEMYPKSFVAANLKACNQFKLYNGDSALAEYRNCFYDENVEANVLADDFKIRKNAKLSPKIADVFEHNLVVFTEGSRSDSATVLKRLVSVVPEAKLNLIVYHLHHDEIDLAAAHLDFVPITPQQFVIFGVVETRLYQLNKGLKAEEHLRKAQQYFQMVGASTTECDTIPGRQCMASCFFLLNQFDDANVYLSSINSYLEENDAYNYNYGQSLCQVGKFSEAEKHLKLVQNEKYKREICYILALSRSLIENEKPEEAFGLCEHPGLRSSDRIQILQVLANDAFRKENFFLACKAFDLLQQLDQDEEYWLGKKGAITEVLKKYIKKTVDQSEVKKLLVFLQDTVQREEVLRRTITAYLHS